MAKRITKLFQKDLQGNFDSEHPIRIGSSAQYITVSESETETLENDETEFLKERLDAIGNPDDLDVNKNQYPQGYERNDPNYNSIVKYLNYIGSRTDTMWFRKLNTSGGTMTGSITFEDNSADIIFPDAFEDNIKNILGNDIFEETTP